MKKINKFALLALLSFTLLIMAVPVHAADIDLQVQVGNDFQILPAPAGSGYTYILQGRINTVNLMAPAYARYLEEKQNNPVIPNLVMMAKNKQFPYIEYNISFPAGTQVGNASIQSTSAMFFNWQIQKPEARKVRFEIRYGAWDDYRTFWNRYLQDASSTNPVTPELVLEIPFTPSEGSSDLSIHGEGVSDLYYYRLHGLVERHLVHISTDSATWQIPSVQ
mgnify:FL=1